MKPEIYIRIHVVVNILYINLYIIKHANINALWAFASYGALKML
jgi:hypothetical protein